MMQQRDMLLVLPVPFRVKDNQLFFEFQACNGLERWADNFGSIIVAAPLMPEALAEKEKTITWRSTATLAEPQRFELVPLPWAYSLLNFLSCYRTVRVSLARLISRCRYLQFGIGGLIGDWGAIGALEACKQSRAYAIHIDRVEHKVLLQVTKGARLQTRIKARVFAPLIASYHKWIIKDCALGLWHGNDCYSAYSLFCNNSHLIHDIHTKPSDSISNEELSEKLKHVATEETIQICYVGRLDPMKAPLDWAQVIARARDLGVKLQATWIGDGSLMDEMKVMIENLELSSCVKLTGFERNRENLLATIRSSHIMLFTHVTPESPRCLIESLVCGTPIVGYHSGYVEDLVKDFGGGSFVPVKDLQKLGDLLVTLSKDRQLLLRLIQAAATNGARFNDEAVFRERSELIKTYLD